MRPVLLLIILLTSGCGQLGPLYLPTSIDTTVEETAVNETAPNSDNVNSDDINSDNASSDDVKELADDPTETGR